MQNYENIGPKTKVKNVCIRNIWSVKMLTCTKKFGGMGFLTDRKAHFFKKRI